MSYHNCRECCEGEAQTPTGVTVLHGHQGKPPLEN